MAANDTGGPRIVVASVFLDPQRRPPRELLRVWRDFGRAAAAAARPDEADGSRAHVAIVQAAWEDDHCEIDGVGCDFVREESPPFIPLPGARALRRVPRRLFRRIAELAPDLIHYEGLVCPRLLRSLARTFPGVPILAQDHGSKPPKGWRRWLWRWGFAPLDGVTFTAGAQADEFKAIRILRRHLPVFEVIEGSTPFTPGDQESARVASGLSGDPCLLWVGNLDTNKDPLTVLDAVARVRSLPNLRVHMCYRRAPLLEAVRSRAVDPALAGRVVLHGEIRYPQIEAHFRAADFLVQASHAEGSGYGVIEALACGTPPLVTDIPSFRRITGNGEFGALVPVGDSDALARAIEDWSGRDRGLLRRRARDHFQRSLSFEAIGRQLRSTYRQVLRQA